MLHCARQEEREDKELRLAEMEATKAQNLLDHEDEIKARPKRSWFLSAMDKASIAAAAKAADSAGEERPGPQGEAAGTRSKSERKAAAKGSHPGL